MALCDRVCLERFTLFFNRLACSSYQMLGVSEACGADCPLHQMANGSSYTLAMHTSLHSQEHKSHSFIHSKNNYITPNNNLGACGRVRLHVRCVFYIGLRVYIKPLKCACVTLKLNKFKSRSSRTSSKNRNQFCVPSSPLISHLAVPSLSLLQPINHAF